MADETIDNGVITNFEDNQTVEIEKETEKSKLETLIRENEESNEKIKLLMDEIDGLKVDRVEMKKRFEEQLDEKQKQIDGAQDDKRALEAISSRAAELEIEVARLQHDLGSSASEMEDLNKELKDVREKEKEMREKIESLEHQTVELEKKVSGSETRVLEKESEILVLKKEKKQIEIENGSIGEALSKSEAKIEELEERVNELQGELEELLEEKKLANGDDVGVGSENLRQDKGLKGLEIQWPVALASTGTVVVAAAAAVAIYYSRRQ